MNALSLVFVLKIAATVLFWCIPLLLFPAALLDALGLPEQPTLLFLRMLGWAYLALCVGYAFGLRAALQGERRAGPIWVGIVSNGGACVYLAVYGALGTWSGWGGFVQFLLWSSMIATAGITLGLYLFGVRQPSGALAKREA